MSRFSFMLVIVTGNHLGAIVHAISYGNCERINEYHAKLTELMDKLHAQAPTRVADVIGKQLYSRWNHHGIYEIREPDDIKTVYVGKTRVARDGVAQRIWDHAKQISHLVSTLEITRQSFAEYQVRSIEIQDARVRGLAECFGIALFDPKGNRVA